MFKIVVFTAAAFISTQPLSAVELTCVQQRENSEQVAKLKFQGFKKSAMFSLKDPQGVKSISKQLGLHLPDAEQLTIIENDRSDCVVRLWGSPYADGPIRFKALCELSPTSYGVFKSSDGSLWTEEFERGLIKFMHTPQNLDDTERATISVSTKSRTASATYDFIEDECW
jgi:hypothetical protein